MVGKYLGVISLLTSTAIVPARSAPAISMAATPGDGPGATQWRSAAAVAASPHSFHFTRGVYSGWRRSWAVDAPDADRWIADVTRRLTFIDLPVEENFVALDDPNLGRFPFVYILEVGGMSLTEPEVEGLRAYLLKGGFLMVDDFWGSYEWANWEAEIRRVLPEYDIVDIPLTHEIFSTMYLVEEVVQVPSVSGARSGYTSQGDGVTPYVRGIFDDDGRLMVIINFNTDLGDAWEWAEAPYYPVQYSTYAYQVAANTFVYALTH